MRGLVGVNACDGPPENTSSVNVQNLAGYTLKERTWNEKEQVHGRADHRSHQGA